MTDNQIVLITGANKGIGFATARELAQAGHTVLLGARDPERGTAAAAALAGQGLDVRFVRLDVADPATIAAAADLIDTEYGRLDILDQQRRHLPRPAAQPGELPVAALRETYETNVFGVVAVTNAMLPLLSRSPAGYIGNVSSGLGTVAFLTDPDSPLWRYANLLGYNSSKAALNAITLIYAASGRRGSGSTPCRPGSATDLNNHTGHLSADEGGAHIARQVTLPATARPACSSRRTAAPTPGEPSAPADKGHGRGGDGQELYVRVQRQCRHVEHGVGDVLRVEGGLGRHAAVGLEHAVAHGLGHVGGRVADVDLAAGDAALRPSSETDLVRPVIACLVAV